MRKGEQTRQEIIRKAAPLFNQRGYEGTALSDLMQATGLEKGGIYRHFDSKQELAGEAFDHAWKLATDTRFQGLDDVPNTVDRLQHFVRNFRERRSGLVPGGCPLLNTAIESDDGNLQQRGKARQALHSWLHRLQSIVEEGQRKGEIQSDNPMLTTSLRRRHYLYSCVGRIGADRKGNAHLRQVNTGAPMPNLDTPNLENLKKQAKQYLRWHRERYYPVAARIRAALSRFRHLSDEKILDANFKLADAQELVARERGFERWQALKSGAHLMPHHAMTHEAMTHEARQTAPRPILNSTEAQLFVADIRASCDFYTDKLGFTVAFVYGDPPYYGQVTRDHARLNLRVVGEPVFVGDIREREHLLSASLTVASTDEIKQLFLSYKAAGVRFRQTLKKEPWGARTFIVLDPDGNLILFAGPAD